MSPTPSMWCPDLSSTNLWAHSYDRKSPTTGLSLTIPFVVLGEVVALDMGIDGQSLLRATFVLIKFITLGVEGSDSDESEELILRVEATRTERVGGTGVTRSRVMRGR